MDDQPKGIDRRDFLRKAALTGAAAAWAAPVIQTVVARPAFAQAGSPSECRHSAGPWFTNGVQQNPGNEEQFGGCMQACKNASQGPTGGTTFVASSLACTQICDGACPSGRGADDRVCCDGSFCESTSFVRENWQKQHRVCYVGGATCSPITCAQNS